MRPTRPPLPCSVSLPSLLLGSLLLSALTPAARAEPSSSPLAPRALFEQRAPRAQMDDPDLVRELKGEETLNDLQDMEYDREAMSLGRGVTLSFIPGGGFGMMYAGKRAQGLLTVALAAVGYGVGLAFASGSLDSAAVDVCVHTPTNTVVPASTCSRGEPTPKNPLQHLEIDPRSVTKEKYFQTKGNYAQQTRGTAYDGGPLGLKLLVGTYVVTTALGALLAGSAISEHNDEVRKRVESTAGLDVKLAPTVVYDGRSALLGLGGSF